MNFPRATNTTQTSWTQDCCFQIVVPVKNKSTNISVRRSPVFSSCKFLGMQNARASQTRALFFQSVVSSFSLCTFAVHKSHGSKKHRKSSLKTVWITPAAQREKEPRQKCGMASVTWPSCSVQEHIPPQEPTPCLDPSPRRFTQT